MGRGSKRWAALGIVGAFLVATGVAGAAGTLFQPYQAFAVGSWPEAVAIGDVTGDGLPDVVLTTGFNADPANDYRVFVFAQTESGGLARPVLTYASGQNRRLQSVAVGDLTGDGRADVVVGVDGGGVQVFAQRPEGTLDPPAYYPTANGRLVRLGHLNADARLDVAAIGWGTNTVSVLLNDGAGGLQAPVQYPAQHAGWDDLEVGDVTGDGLDDLVVMSGQSYAVPNVSVLAQLPAGGFGAPAEYRVGTNVNTQGLGVGDVTGDGRNDVVASYGGNSPNARLAVFAQNAAGTLDTPVPYTSYDIPEPVEVADVDLDGLEDVVTLHGGWSRAGVYVQTGGRLASEDLYTVPYASHYGPHGLAVGDVSSDGRPDVVVADYNHGLVVLPSNGPPPPPPPTADVGVDVTASGSRVRPRKPFWFDVKVTNASQQYGSITALTVQLSGGPTNLSENSTSCSFQSTTMTCSLAMLPDSSTTVRITGTAPRKGSVGASATVDGDVDDPNASNDTDSAVIAVR